MTRPVSHDLAVEALARAEELDEALGHVYSADTFRPDLAGKLAHAHTTMLKRAAILADLAIAEALADGLDALDVPVPFVLADGDVERPLAVVRSSIDEALEGAPAAAVHAHLCTAWDSDVAGPCGREAVVFPPALCGLHGGLE